MSRGKRCRRAYTRFLQTNGALSFSATEFSRVSAMSHDAVSRWLAEGHGGPEEVWQHALGLVTKGGFLIGDDSPVEHPYGPSIELTADVYDSASGKIVNGIPLVALLWSNGKRHIVVDYRVPGAQGTEKMRITNRAGEVTIVWKTKNELFLDMLKTAKKRGFSPVAVLFDGWYAACDNLKWIENHGWKFGTRLKKNRQVSVDGRPYCRVDELDWGKRTAPQAWIQGYGRARIVRTALIHRSARGKKAGVRYLVTNELGWRKGTIVKLYKKRWAIEEQFRIAKQALGIHRCPARHKESQLTHIYSTILALLDTEKRRLATGLTAYQQRAETFRAVTREQLRECLA